MMQKNNMAFLRGFNSSSNSEEEEILTMNNIAKLRRQLQN